METISNAAATAASTASKLLWGEQGAQDATTKSNETAGQEPVSGQKGKGTVDDPYDRGNLEDATDPSKTTTTADLPDRTLTEPTAAASETTSTPSNNLSASEPLKEADKTGDVATESSPNVGAAPSLGAAPEVHKEDTDKSNVSPKDDETKDPKEEAEDFMKKRDPNDHSGEPMKMHGSTEKNEIPTTQEARRDSKVGNPGGQEHGKEPKGTGEEWVKTTGLQADGGDFDATKPGAGREADRLMEEKGVKKSSPVPEEASTISGGSGSGEEKRSKMKKLKEKLHIGHKEKA